MPDQRTHQTVAERLELQLERCPNPLHQRRRWLTLAGGVVPLLVVGAFVARGDHTIFLAQPVAESHQHFQSDCQTCHRTPWQPLVRLANADAMPRSVRDEDCQQCHAQDKSDHHSLAKNVSDCIACHQEHRGSIRLTDRADVACVRCHEPFDKHPQFALLRDWPLEREANASASARRKRLEEVATLRPGDAGGEPSQGRWVDKAALKFSHAGHLAPLVAKLNRGATAATSPLPRQLVCADCHVLDANGLNMQPIVYEKHCQECHPLRFSSKLDLASATDSNDRGHLLPHESPEIVRSVMRDRLIANAPRLRDAPAASNAASRLPNGPADERQEEWEWVAEELRVLENAIFRLPADDAATPSSNACLKCHEADNSAAAFSIKPPRIPTRWMHSEFPHDRHLSTSCVDCHPVPDAGQAIPAEATGFAVAAATPVQAIMMPTMETCQSCHGATQGTHASFRPARKNCTECHQYHHVPLTKASHDPAPH